jgi:hypothetical protein
MNGADKIERLEQWKADAITILDGWDDVWEAAGKPGPWGASKHESTRDYVAALRAEHEELKQWISDACELFHDINYWWTGHTAMPRSVWQDDRGGKITDLLRRVENP